MRLSLIFLFVILLPVNVFATAQLPEYVIYQNKKFKMYATPLESYFTKNNPKPEKLFKATSSGLWRGYQGVWTIKDDKLYLTELHGSGGEIPAKKIFKKNKYPVLASWYSGKIRLPQGKRLSYVHMGFGSVYEKEVLIIIKNGKVVAKKKIDNTGKHATRSASDMEWVALATEPVKDNGDWYDARLIATKAFQNIMVSGTKFKTRGVYAYSQQQKIAFLWTPDTPTTRAQSNGLNKLPSSHEGKLGAHVEIEAHFVKDGDHYKLHVDTIRNLKPGETIHHPDFKLSDLK